MKMSIEIDRPERNERILLHKTFYSHSGYIINHTEDALIVHPDEWSGESMLKSIGDRLVNLNIDPSEEQMSEWYQECIDTPFPEVRNVIMIGKTESQPLMPTVEYTASLESFDEYASALCDLFRKEIAGFTKRDSDEKS